MRRSTRPSTQRRSSRASSSARGTLLAVLLLLLAGCTAASDGSAEPAPGDGSAMETDAAQEAAVDADAQPDEADEAVEAVDPVEVSTWSSSSPPTAAGLTRVGDLGVYFGETGENYQLVGIDLITGEILWQRPAHQHGRIRGVVPSPTVDRASGTVFVTRYTLTGAVELVAFDLDGQERWAAGTEWAESAPRLCADGLVCVPATSGATLVHDRTTGELLGQIDTILGRTIGGDAGTLVTADIEGRRVQSGRVTPDVAHEVDWDLDHGALFGAENAELYSPNGGWAVHRDDDLGRTVVLLGRWLDPDEVGFDAYSRAVARDGSGVALVTDDGEVLERWSGVSSCPGMSLVDDGQLLLCEDLGLVELDPDVEDGLDDGTSGDEGSADEDGAGPDIDATYQRISMWDIEDGQQLWTTELAAPTTRWGAEAQFGPTSDEELVAAPIGGEELLLDLRDGTLQVDDAPDGLLRACIPDFEGELLGVTLRTFDGETLAYLRAYDEWLARPCDQDGAELEVVELLAEGRALPSWFGFAPEDEDDVVVDDERAELGRSWAVWVEPDGTLRGAGPSE